MKLLQTIKINELTEVFINSYEDSDFGLSFRIRTHRDDGTFKGEVHLKLETLQKMISKLAKPTKANMILFGKKPIPKKRVKK